MPTPSSTNPNVTSGSAAASGTSLRFPLDEDPVSTCRLRFATYERFTPGQGASEETTVMITMPLPIPVTDSSSIKSTTYDMGALKGLFDNATMNDATTSVSQLREIIEQGYSEMSRQISDMGTAFKQNAIRALALAPQLSDSQRAVAGIYGGIVANPHTNLLFDGVNLKTHNLTWRVSPRSQQESEALKRIVDTIKMRIHPEEVFRGYALDYPDIVYVTWTGPAANYLPTIRKGMVTGFQASTGNMNYHRDGSPIDLELTMTINEMTIITRNTLRGE